MNNVPLSVVQSLVGHSSPLMTGAYSHSNRLAEQQAVAGLPSINGDAAQPARRTPVEILRDLQAIIESMAVKNFREKRIAALAMLATVTA